MTALIMRMMLKKTYEEDDQNVKIPNLLDEWQRLRGQKTRVAHIIIDNAVKHLFLIISWEGRLQRESDQVITGVFC